MCQVSKLEAELEDAARRSAAAQLEAARALDSARSQAAAAEREAEVLRAGAGAATDQALATLKVCHSKPELKASFTGCSSKQKGSYICSILY
jgi:hypothetical protein